jgi:hypothetical protein
MPDKARNNPLGKRLLLALGTLLFGALLYGSLITEGTPASFTFEVQSGTVDSNPALRQTFQELQREQQELQTLQNGSPNR